MRSKRRQKIPHNLEDFVHSINTTKTKNKARVSEMNDGEVVSQKMNEHKNGENRREHSQDEFVLGRCGIEEIDEIESNVYENSDKNLSDVRFSSASNKEGSKVDDNKEVLENEAGEGVKAFNECGNDDDECNGSVKRSVQMNEVGNKSDSKLNDKKESSGGVWNMRFVDIVKANQIENKLEEISTELGENGVEVVVLNDEMIELGCEKWKNTVCGFFIGGYVTYNEARYHLRRMWNKYGFIDILKNDGGVFLFKFQDDKGMDEVVRNGPWLVNNKPMFVQKWKVGMVLDKAEPSKLPIWVKILNVPMEAWSVKGISALASSLGKPIIMDEMTAKMCAKGEGRLSFARVLIEIDAGKKLKQEIEVVYKGNKCHDKFTKTIKVEYAWKPNVVDYYARGFFWHANKS
ncbi:zinc knuckle CX2CX4HX4C containing protein [Tanacetum coccineum]